MFKNLSTKGAFKNKWFTLLVIIAFILIIVLFFKKILNRLPHEGFTQDAPFISKRNNDIYDSYYAMIYDDIYCPKPRTEYEYQKIIDMTHPTVGNSIFLDVGSGTGTLVNELSSRGFEAHGIDKSKAMVEVSQLKYPDTIIKCGDVKDSMIFDRSIFTHITCMNFTLYEIEDHAAFFRNCYHWLRPNGYLILHLVNRDKYNPIVPGAIPSLLDNPQKYTKDRITKSMINFYDFTYNNSTYFDKPGEVLIKETFKDVRSGNVRENEILLKMDSIKNILFLAQRCGFIPHSQVDYKTDENQFIVILEKMQ